MTYAFCIVMALLPSWLLVRYFVKNDKFPEPTATWMVPGMGVCRLLGFAVCHTTVSVLFLDEWVANSDIIVGSAVAAFGAAAIPEEFSSIKCCVSAWLPTKILMNRWMGSSMVQ